MHIGPNPLLLLVQPQMAMLQSQPLAQLQMLQQGFGGASGMPIGLQLMGAAPGMAMLNASPGMAMLNASPGMQMLGGMGMPPPTMACQAMAPICGQGYANPSQSIDLGHGASDKKFLGMFTDSTRRDAAKFERLIQENPSVRASFESQVGGTYVNDGRNDGRITIQRFPQGMAPVPGMANNPMSNTMMGMLGGMDAAVAQQAGYMNSLANPYGGGNPNQFIPGMSNMGVGALGAGLLGAGALGMAGSAFLGAGGLLGGAALGGTGAGMMGPNPLANMLFAGMGPMGQAMGVGLGFGGGAFGGVGVGSFNPLAMPGRINNTNPFYERMHQAQTTSVLADPSLTVEDKVALVMMLIMKKMDKDIERQLEYINSLQNQQGKNNKKGGKKSKGGGLLGGAAGAALGGPMGAKVGSGVGSKAGGKAGGGTGQDTSVDVETQKLTRMITKRTQMFDMLKSIIDKYNETAKGMIQSIGR